MTIVKTKIFNDIAVYSENLAVDIENIREEILFTSDEMAQLRNDFDTLSDQELADKYPNLTREWIPDDQLSLFKKKLVYLFEQSIVYLDVGGYSPGGKGPLVKSDLRYHHLPNTVESTILTLRNDLAPKTNRPFNDLESADPYLWVWENDDNEWKQINIRRIHHIFDMFLRKWYPNQFWLCEKLDRFTASIKYYENYDDAVNHHPLYSKTPLDVRTKTTTVTLDPSLMPELPQQEMAESEPIEARWDLNNKVKFWDTENKQWLTLSTYQILDMEVNEEKIPSTDEKHKKPSNWRQLRDGIDKFPKYD